MSLIEINRLILDVIEKVNKEQGEDYIDIFTIQTAHDGILLTLWEREFPKRPENKFSISFSCLR